MKTENVITNDYSAAKDAVTNETTGRIIPLGNEDRMIYKGKAQRELHRMYGDPRVKGWGNNWMTLWRPRRNFPWFPAEKVYIHKDFREKLTKALYLLEMNGLYKEIKTYDGCYNLRAVRGTASVLSVHSWGCAIDLNAAQNALGEEPDWSEDFMRTMELCGIYCGGRWHGRPDGMHFSLVNG